MAETTEGGGQSCLWSHKQRRQLQALNILPFDLSDSNAYLYRCRRDSTDFEENMRRGVEVGTAFDVCGEKDYSRLRQAGKLPKPVDACSRDQLLLVQRYAAIYQEDEEPALVIEERLGESVVHNHGFWPMKEMPYIVARPRAIILPEMGLHDTCTLLDVYELDNFGGCPDAIPQYAGIIPKTVRLLLLQRTSPLVVSCTPGIRHTLGHHHVESLFKLSFQKSI